MPRRRWTPFTRKLLGFTDNRQDAALQAGHFNDFLFVSLVRAGFLGALQDAGLEGIRSDELGIKQQQTLGFDRPDPQVRAEWLIEPTLRGFNLLEAESTLRQVLTYRIWYDQRRGWRYTNPNLEQLGMVQVQYLGLEDLASDDQLFADSSPLLRHATGAVRAAVYRELLDHMRKWMAIRSQVLDTAVLEQLVAKSHSRLRPPWGLGIQENTRASRWLMIVAPTRRRSTIRDMDLIVRGGSRSSLGRTLRSTSLWGNDSSIRDLKSKQFDQLVEDLLRAAATHGLVSEESTPFDQPGWRLNDACVLFQLGDLSQDPRRPHAKRIFPRPLREPRPDAPRAYPPTSSGSRRASIRPKSILPTARSERSASASATGSAPSLPRTRSASGRPVRPAGSCRSSFAPRRWNSASTSRH